MNPPGNVSGIGSGSKQGPRNGAGVSPGPGNSGAGGQVQNSGTRHRPTWSTSTASGAPTGRGRTQSGFRTDADISGRGERPVERRLEKWADNSHTGGAPSKELEDVLDLSKAPKGHWDQFCVNREKFGVESTYDEHYYTTAIDRSHPEYAERERRAERIAREIESSGHGGNVHVAEERGVVVDDSGLDEEDRFSGVQRSTPASGGPSIPTGPASSTTPSDRGSASSWSKGEARKIAQSPSYLADREKLDRISDFKKFSQNFRVQSPVPPDLVPILGRSPSKKAESTPAPTATSGTPKVPAATTASTAEKPKKRFNFNAAAAKASSFRPTPRFVPMVPPPGGPVRMTPSPPIPAPNPVMGVAPVPMPPSVYAPPSASVTPGPVSSRNTSPGPLKPLETADFDLFARHRRDGTEPQVPFATPPVWPTASETSYRDMLTGPMPPRVMPMPYGFVVPPAF